MLTAALIRSFSARIYSVEPPRRRGAPPRAVSRSGAHRRPSTSRGRPRRRRGGGPCWCRHRSSKRACPIHERPAGDRRGVSSSRPRGLLLLLERADVVHQLPALLLREMLPGRHGATAVRDLPENLAVGFLRDLVGRPVGRLRRRERGGGGAVAPPAAPARPRAGED